MKTNNKLFTLTLTALFIAIMLVMDFTPLGYITTGLFSITLMTIPVAIGAICIGVVPAAVLGLLFGLTSFLQAFGIGYLIDPTASILFSEKPLSYVIMCFVPRIIAGISAGLVFAAFKKNGHTGIVAMSLSSVCVPVLNTSLFLTAYILLYRDTVLMGKTFMTVFISALSVNCLIEILFTVIVASAVSRVLYKYLKRIVRN